ncbi:phage tail terminator-like protein [Pseudomonas sp.]|uniref:phage tail terminator-like protein n=1 Tax=Pseudomonas sp. TaxID=306 RepID=UPI00290B7F82|nr:phage tail terminator-like protein [Pseudomonas sp.]MDU4249005.1 phage tail terminator-like protein [Pseudomonas sp.]
MSEKIIRSIYEARLKAWAAARSPALRVTYQNSKFSPASGETYLACYLLPAKTQSLDLEGVHKVFTGYFQVNIVVPTDSSLVPASGIAEELQALFPNNLGVTKSGLTVYVRTPCAVADAQQDVATATVPVSFYYRADTP